MMMFDEHDTWPRYLYLEITEDLQIWWLLRYQLLDAVWALLKLLAWIAAGIAFTYKLIHDHF